MNNPIKQSVAVTIQMGPALDAGDGVAEETGLSPTVELSKANAAFAARDSAGAINHDANGWYRVPLNTTDVATAGRLIAKFDDAATHLPVWHEFTVVPVNVYDSLVGGTDALRVHTSEITADLINSTAIASAAIADQAVASVVGSVASVSGSVGSMAADGLNSTSVKSGALAGETIAAVSGNVAGNVVGTVASVTGNVDGNVTGSVASVSGNVDGNVTGSIGSLAAQAKTDVNAEVADVIKTDTIAEQAQGVPPATPTLEQAAGYLYMALRNEITVDASDKTFANDAGTVIHKKALSDDGTYTEAKSVSGP